MRKKLQESLKRDVSNGYFYLSEIAMVSPLDAGKVWEQKEDENNVTINHSASSSAVFVFGSNMSQQW